MVNESGLVDVVEELNDFLTNRFSRQWKYYDFYLIVLKLICNYFIPTIKSNPIFIF